MKVRGRPQVKCFYCFELFGTLMKHEARVFDMTYQSHLKIMTYKACKISVFPAGKVNSS